jgi:hypothetical protein
MKLTYLFLLLTSFCYTHAQDPMYCIRDVQSRSITPENRTGAKAGGSRTELKDGSAKYHSRFLGKHWKVNPWVNIPAGKTEELANFNGEGTINSIWLTLSTEFYRTSILEFYWDGASKPSVQVPIGDFFAQHGVKHPSKSGWANGFDNYINSFMININPYNGLNCYWQMPFRKGFRVVLRNLSKKKIEIFYQINFTLEKLPKNAGYFHAQYRREKEVPFKTPYTLIDNVKGKGHIAGIFLLHGHGKQVDAWFNDEKIVKNHTWWGEGEIKFYLDGDDQYPTINTTGEEDYFCGSWCYVKQNPEFGKSYRQFSSLYNGFYRVGKLNLFGQYRWHVKDPIYFSSDMRITMQALGWYGNGTYVTQKDDISSVVFWYQDSIYTDFPLSPSIEELKMNYNDYLSPHETYE